MRKEMRRPWHYIFKFFLVSVPLMVESALRRADREPYYRRIVVIQRHAKSHLTAAKS
jgi:hypothetical protein